MNLMVAVKWRSVEFGGYKHGWSKSGKSILLHEIRQPRTLSVRISPSLPRRGDQLSEVEQWTDRLRRSGFRTVDALRARPISPRVFFLLDAPAEIRQRAERIANAWQGLITWHPDNGLAKDFVQKTV
jgi:hypothetical protein